MIRFLYLFCSQWRWARMLIGGKWVRKREPGYEWVMWGNMLGDHLAWPLNPDEFEMENYP